MAGPGMLGVRKGAWTKQEDELLKQFMENHGEGKWHQVPLRAGLNRCRKSCRLRWLNYLRPNIKRGDFADDEVDLIIRLHKLLGNRWSLIAGRLDGRTANDVKNYWNTYQRKRMASDVVAKRIKDESPNIKSGSVVVVRPRPRHFIKRSKCSESKKTESVEHTEPAQKTISMPNLPTTSPLLPVESVTDSTEVADIDWWKTLSGNYSTDSTEFGTTYSGVGLEEDIFTNFWIQDMDINELLIDSTI